MVEIGAWKVPFPFPNETFRRPLPYHTTSNFPSLLKSPTAVTVAPEKTCLPVMATAKDGTRMGKNTTFDVPPPGGGFVTVTDAVRAFATSEALIVALNSVLEITMVRRGERFHLSTAVGAKPVPVTVKVNA